MIKYIFLPGPNAYTPNVVKETPQYRFEEDKVIFKSQRILNDTLIFSLAARQKELKKFVTPAPGMYEVL